MGEYEFWIYLIAAMVVLVGGSRLFFWYKDKKHGPSLRWMEEKLSKMAPPLMPQVKSVKPVVEECTDLRVAATELVSLVNRLNREVYGHDYNWDTYEGHAFHVLKDIIDESARS